MNHTFWLEIDIITFLELDKTLSPMEAEGIVGELNDEIWFRILNEELPKKLPKDRYDKLVSETELETDLNTIVNKIAREEPSLSMPVLLQTVSSTVKKEFVIEYLKDIQQESPKIKNLAEKALSLIEEEKDEEELVLVIKKINALKLTA